VKPLDDRWCERWTQDRVDVVLDVSLVAGPEENDIDPLLVTRVAVGGIGDASRTAVGDHERERIAFRQHRRVELALLDQRGEGVAPVGGVAEQVADDEHQKRADPSTLRHRKDLATRALVHEAVGQHGDFPGGFLDRPGEHLLFRIVGARLGDADMAHLALLLEPDEGGRQDVAMVLVGCWRHGVEMEDVHVVEAEPLQPGFHLARD